MLIVSPAARAAVCIALCVGCDASGRDDAQSTTSPEPSPVVEGDDAAVQEPEPESSSPGSASPDGTPTPETAAPETPAPEPADPETPGPETPCASLPSTCETPSTRADCGPSLLAPALCTSLDERCELRECYLDCLDQPCATGGLIGAEGELTAEACVARCESSFYCDGQFLPVVKVCDGVDDCPSGRDEADESCTWPDIELECYPGQTAASSQQLCDGNVDCPRGEDEPCPERFTCQPCSCAEDAQNRCPAEVDCGTDETATVTVDREQLGDGTADCPLGEDEHLPQQLSCLERDREQWCQLLNDRSVGYLCQGTEMRIPRRDVCNGEADCPLGDDEPCSTWVEQCPEQHELVAEYLQTIGTRDLMGAVLAMENDFVCSLSDSPELCPFLSCDDAGCRFPCNNGQFLYPQQVADGIPNCPDGEDEPCAPSLRCSNGTAIPFDRVCDGSEDCADGSDESECPRYPKPFVCGDGSQIVFPALACPEYRCNDLSDAADCIVID